MDIRLDQMLADMQVEELDGYEDFVAQEELEKEDRLDGFYMASEGSIVYD